MNPFLQTILVSEVVRRLAWVLVHSMWLGVVVAAALAVCRFALRRRSAGVRYLAGCGAMVAMVMLTAASWFFTPARPQAVSQATPSPVAARTTPAFADTSGSVNLRSDKPPENVPPKPSIPIGSTAVARSVSTPTTSGHAASAPPSIASFLAEPPTQLLGTIDGVLPWLVPIWVAGVLALACWQFGGWHEAHQIRRQAATPRDPSFRDMLATAIEKLGIRVTVDLLESASVKVPALVGWLRPVILLPIGLATGLTKAHLEAILLHELAHVRRHDYLANLLQVVVETLFFYHPAVWYLSAGIRSERENCCDDLVTAFGAEPTVYAESLLRVAERAVSTHDGILAPKAMVLGATGRSSALRRRVRRLLGGNDPAAREGWPASMLVVVVVAALALLFLSNATAPSAPAAQQPASKPADDGKLAAGVEEKLRWGEPQNGMRAAIVIRGVEDLKSPEKLELFLAVQNVSKAPVRLSETVASPKLRHLYLKVESRIVMGLGSQEPTGVDVVLQPRETALLLMFPGAKFADGRTTGSVFAEGALKDANQSMVAEFEIENAPAGAWKGKLKTGDSTGAAASGRADPKDKSGLALLVFWQKSARANGDIPGGQVSRLGAKVKEFVKNNTGDASGNPYAKKMQPLLSRFEGAASRDWKQTDVVELLDAVATANDIPLETTLEELSRWQAIICRSLPAELVDAPWGQPAESGLRIARPILPRADQYPFGQSLKSPILIHNVGKQTVFFAIQTFHQAGGQARDAKGAAVEVDGIFWTTRGRNVFYRLSPGDYCELNSPGIGIGTETKGDWEWSNIRVGAWIHAKVGDDVCFTPGAVATNGADDHQLGGEPKAADVWQKFVVERVERELPLPDSAADRESLLRRISMDVFGVSPTAEEIAALVADKMPDAWANLQKRLLAKPGITPFAGTLTPGEIRFHVQPADADAAKRPRVATGPGDRTLGDNARLVTVQRPDGDRRVNEAFIKFSAADPNAEPPGKPYEVKLPDGDQSWAVAWVSSSKILWILDKGGFRSCDFSDSAQVKETSRPVGEVPEPVRVALQSAVSGNGSSKPPAARAPVP